MGSTGRQPDRDGLLDRLTLRALSTRWLTRAPITLYRHGLGFLLGSRLLMLEHLGRKSGEPRFVVIECVDRDEERVLVASGFGGRADWYRNLVANGVAFVSTGRLRRIPAIPRFLDPEESARRLERYAAQHPTAWRRLESAMSIAAGGKADIRLVELTLQEVAE